MQQLTYASKSFVTTDAVTEALLDLVTAIDRQDHSEAVTVPAFTEDGELIEAKMTLDASSELVAVPVEVAIKDEESTTDAVDAAVEDIRSRIKSNRATIARPLFDEDPEPYDYEEF
ncbi:hypothetical protein [Rathayibacter tanaceti]|uniref:Uncharacterized protein n=2 Tax=Rathayibacter tanaceti TaxID=1671680 RepID=A0A166HVM6_9MICO|nr:hypothetical protein [Rathayibacter tanaceti]KZX21225.1 hypothetical protein ACH61_01640 [Rathayibacter tanaceti]QHC56812.1 hypothetical protein GSU10_15030 [Rathayibacter tanaceti]TCO37826.1 hypothetical protein EV639_10310 [Rathayibacter tanaceti]